MIASAADATRRSGAALTAPCGDVWQDRAVIWLLRHGDAESGSDDAARRLTDGGERQAEEAGRALASLGIGFDACLSSPKVRAMDTARLACRHLGVEPETADELAGGEFDPEQVAARAASGGTSEVLLVGHEPDISDAIARTTGAAVKVKKGGVAAVSDGVLHVLMRPDELGAIAGR
jgi:phosphohistidine phosphatase